MNSPHKGQWREALMFSLIWAWINGWINNREAGDFRRYRAHYDVIGMISQTFQIKPWKKQFSCRCIPHSIMFNRLVWTIFFVTHWLFSNCHFDTVFFGLCWLYTATQVTHDKEIWQTFYQLLLKDLIMQHTKFQIYVLNFKTTFWLWKKITLGLKKGVHHITKWRANNGSGPWWRHQMETFSPLLAICAGNSPVTGEFLAQRPVTRSFDVFFDLRLNKRLSKQSWGWWFETLSCPLWRHRNAFTWMYTILWKEKSWQERKCAKRHKFCILFLMICQTWHFIFNWNLDAGIPCAMLDTRNTVNVKNMVIQLCIEPSGHPRASSLLPIPSKSRQPIGTIFTGLGWILQVRTCLRKTEEMSQEKTVYHEAERVFEY